jgi:hypothetical protein
LAALNATTDIPPKVGQAYGAKIIKELLESYRRSSAYYASGTEYTLHAIFASAPAAGRRAKLLALKLDGKLSGRTSAP